MADKQPYGAVTYADPGHQADKVKRYPVDTAEHVKAAWSYINMPKNASKYSSSDLAAVKGKIKAAASKFGVKINDDSSNSAEQEGEWRSEYPTENLIRMAADAPQIKDGRTMHGIVIPYNKPAEIRGWEGHFMERIRPGAARKAMAENTPKVLFNHGMDSKIGEWPIGKPSHIEERAEGVYAEVPVAETSYGDDLLALVEAGAIDGWSWRFSVPKGKETWTRPTQRGELPQREVHEMRVPEFGPVTFPAYEATTMGVRSMRELSIWRDLPNEQRAVLEEMFAQSADLGTSDEEAASGTSEDEAADHLEEPELPDDLTDDGQLIERQEVVEEEHHSARIPINVRAAYVRRMQANKLMEDMNA